MLTILRYLAITIALVSGGVWVIAALLYLFEVLIARVTDDMSWIIHNWAMPFMLPCILSFLIYILLTEVQMRGGK